MPQGYPRPGGIYQHFKGKLYQIVTIATHSETQEPLVIYQALYPPFQTYARPLAMFTNPVDTEKYPDAGQVYRFQLAEPSKDGNGEKQSVGAGQDGGEPPFPDSASAAEGNPTAAAESKTLSADEKLMAFFDAETMDEKYKILLDMQNEIPDRMINNMAVVLDVVIEEGPLDLRYEELKTCVRTFRKYEPNRFR